MSSIQLASNPALCRVNATVLRLSRTRQCIMGTRVVPNHPDTEVSYQAWYSEQHSTSYICKDTLIALGWEYYVPPPGRTLNPRGGVFKPIGWVELYVQQPVAPFEWKMVLFHVLDEQFGIEVVDVYGRSRVFDIIIGDASCVQLLGEAFNYEFYNLNEAECERQRRDEYDLYLAQYAHGNVGDAMDFIWYAFAGFALYDSSSTSY
ncbi:hypothetical protein QBC41DRAFT_130259 [Cercophora samala]|uniref:Uncharacterized protein n=1 Tax=Cercophora samala TaxID=330535 RepID=A0AA40DBK0_9PEZI|nr:hypothetical protein QBC41DRAFT_130259 [Cercophora samala]